jgi:hypothetical protein
MVLEEGVVTLDEIRKALLATRTLRGEALEASPLAENSGGSAPENRHTEATEVPAPQREVPPWRGFPGWAPR